MKNWILLVAILVTAGCAGSGQSTSGEAVAEAEGDTELVCRRVKKVGSNFTETVCRTRREMDADQADAQQRLQQQRQRNATGGTISSGG